MREDMPNRQIVPAPGMLASDGELINILGVGYIHTKTANGGEMYLTRYGSAHRELLDIANWYETEWFESHRERLQGTSYVYRVPTKPVGGRSLNLVVKYSRVGEDVPVNTQILNEFLNAEFNSPWEEFALCLEMREGDFGPRDFSIHTQRPLAIYVPPEPMQLWQTGRSRTKINKIMQLHPGLGLDILRQYIMVYEWIEGLNVVETLESFGCSGGSLDDLLRPITLKVIGDMEAKGYVVADMKPSHIIVGADRISEMTALPGGADARDRQIGMLQESIRQKDYSVIDYELLLRTPPHDTVVKSRRRHSYLDDQRDRFQAAELPPHLAQVEIFGVPFVYGHAESTGGSLWVIGRNPRLFDYFLPERWRKTLSRPLSSRHEIFYTLTKDNIHIVWKTSRVGEWPADEDPAKLASIRERGFNSPFEECAIAQRLSDNGVNTAYMRAIYMTGSQKIEPVMDPRRYASHRELHGPDGAPLLREDRNYVTIRGYFNGPDAWVASHEGALCQPVDLQRASHIGLVPRKEGVRLLGTTRGLLADLGYDGSLLELNDLLLAIDPAGQIVRDATGQPETRICNFELIHPL